MSKRNWTPEEVETLQAIYPTATADELLAALPGRTIVAIRLKGQAVAEPARPIFWTVERNEMFRTLYPRAPQATLMEAFGVTAKALQHHAAKLGVRKEVRTVSWTPERRRLLRAHYANTPWPELMALLGATEHAIRKMAWRLGLHRDTTWTPARIQFLRDNYATASKDDIMANLPSTWEGIKWFANSLGLKRPKRLRRPKPVKIAKVPRVKAEKPIHDPTPLGERHRASLNNVAAWRAANAAVSPRLDPDTRADVIADVLVAHYAGELAVEDFPAAAREALLAHNRANQRGGLVSLDAPVAGIERLRLGDTISNDDYAARWDSLGERAHRQEDAA